jgi:hypothetical protein
MACGLSREDLEDLLAEHPETVPLLVQVLYAAGMNGHDETLRAMGASLGLAAHAAEHGQFDALSDIESALRAMRDFDARHFTVLRDLIEHPLGHDAAGVPEYEPLTVGHVAARTGIAERSVAVSALHLAGAGLVAEVPALTIDADESQGSPSVYVQEFGSGRAYTPTDLGRAVLAAADISR